MKKYIITIIAIIAIGFSVYSYFLSKQLPENQEKKEMSYSETQTSEATQITIKDFSFSPSTITVKKGESITWTNKDSAPHTATSNPHPIHTDLPELSSGVLQKDGEYTFTFTKTGTFGYHCHIHPSMLGTIIVTE